ncbi:hypothetical protein ACFLXB_08830 [Chloroflexota bacterium]
MHRVSITGLLLVLLCACSSIPVPTLSTALPTITATPDPIREEELVYAALLQSEYSSNLYVLMNKTQTELLGMADVETIQMIEKSLNDLSSDTLADFRARNDESHLIRTSMILGTRYNLFSTEDMQNLFRENQNGWDIFYDRFPEAPGIITLSKVGFNDEMDQALVYLGIQSHWLAGAGTYYLLTRKDGNWFVLQEVMIWIS